MKALPLELKNKFDRLKIDDTETYDIVDTGCTTPIGATPSERGTEDSVPNSPSILFCHNLFDEEVETKKAPINTKKHFVRMIRPKSKIMVKVGLQTMDTHRMVDVNALLDSGATGMFIDKKFVEGNGIAMHELEKPIRVFNVD